VALSLLSIVLLVGLTVGGYSAYFSDSKTSCNNTFTAGILDLAVSCAGNTIFSPSDSPLPQIFKYLPANNPLKPGDKGDVTIGLHMKPGSLNADVWMQVTNLGLAGTLTPAPFLRAGCSPRYLFADCPGGQRQ
jgi:predicted ribosomally synthesized peptide with SipW-like signal peptide